MKHGKWKEIFSIIASVLIALLLFLLLFLRFHWNLILCMVLGAVMYLACQYAAAPRGKDWQDRS